MTVGLGIWVDCFPEKRYFLCDGKNKIRRRSTQRNDQIVAKRWIDVSLKRVIPLIGKMAREKKIKITGIKL